MLKSTVFAAALLATTASFAPPALAQPAPKGLPSAEIIANADKFDPPKLVALAAKLASQPDFVGQWSPMEPTTAGGGPAWDPAHTFYPPQPLKGESGFGPVPGTYIQGIPYNAEWQKKYQDLIKETTEGKSRDDFPACFPYGVPRMIGDTPVPFDVIQSPEVMLWYNFYGRTERRIFLDGRNHPATFGIGEDTRTYSGHSVGHWEGNTLVIDTANMLAGYFDETPAPYSDQVHLVERLRLIDTNIMEDQITVTDPVAMTKPWVVTRYYRRVANFLGVPSEGPMPPGGVRSGAAALGGAPAEGPPPGAEGPPPGSPPPSKEIIHSYYDLIDIPCVPNVKMDKNGFQVAILPQELAAQAAAAKAPAKPKAKSARKSPSKETRS